MKLGLQVKYISINSKKDVEELLNLIQLLFKQNTNKEILLIDQLQPIITRGLNKTIRLLKTKKILQYVLIAKRNISKDLMHSLSILCQGKKCKLITRLKSRFINTLLSM